ncbi:MAG: hypothetical protein Q9160_000478 [Pyrenula sp. 1 TL-2023]
MPPLVYEQTRNSVITALLTIYSLAETPIEAPEKEDHGDIDVIVCSPLQSQLQNTGIDAEAAAAMNAIDFKLGKPTSQFAVPWPKHVELPEGTLSAEDHAADEKERPQVFIQVDVITAPSPAMFKWQVFNHCHGDFWNIIGSLIRRYGLTASNSGIYIRIAELEPLDKAAARFFLTNDPTEALRFFGMNEERFWAPFGRKQDLFEYVSTCRFYDPTRFSMREEMKANDRQRLKKRTLFHEWVDEHLPKVREEKKGEWAETSRDDVINIVKDWFGVGERFDKHKKNELGRIRKQTFWGEIRKELPIEGTRAGVALKGLKAEIAAVSKDLSQEEVAKESQVRTWYKENDLDAVKEWALENWSDIERKQLRKEKIACAIHFQKKEMLEAESEEKAITNGGNNKTQI